MIRYVGWLVGSVVVPIRSSGYVGIFYNSFGDAKDYTLFKYNKKRAASKRIAFRGS